MTLTISSKAAAWILLWTGSCVTAHSTNSTLSRHLLIEDLSMVVLMADAIQTPGPFAEQDNDYVTDTNDLTLAGTAGSPGIEGNEDRLSVVNGIPLTLDITVYDVSDPSQGGLELPNVEVLLWHTDAAGIYSAVGDNRQELEDTDGQVWCRGIQTTNSEGVATFQTILPGWYPGRAIHYHFTVRFPGTQLAATSQLYIRDRDLQQYETVAPYSDNPYPITARRADGIFARLNNNPTIQDLLTLTLEGSVDEGYTSSVSVGVIPPEGFTLTTSSPTMAPTVIEATTEEPTTLQPTPVSEPVNVPRPSMTTTIAPTIGSTTTTAVEPAADPTSPPESIPEPVTPQPNLEIPSSTIAPTTTTTATTEEETTATTIPVLPDDPSSTSTESNNAISGTTSRQNDWMESTVVTLLALLMLASGR